MLQRTGLGLTFKEGEKEQASMELRGLQEVGSVDQTAMQQAVVEPPSQMDVSKQLVVTTESSAASKPITKPSVKKPTKAATERKRGTDPLYDSPWTRAAKK